MISDSIKCLLINFKNIIRLKKHRVNVYQDIYEVKDDKNIMYIARLNRHNRSKMGIIPGIDMLAKQYCLDEINITDGSLLIECGANIGELSIWAKKNGLNYIGFEPEEKEHKCVELNSPKDSLVHKKALWNKKEKLKMYSLPNSGDSSVFDMGGSTSTFEIDAVRLDEAIDLSGYSGTVILKVEAEGAEPEVLEGAKKILDNIDYVTIDCGPERGVEQEYTFIQTNNIMIENGFTLINIKFDRTISLYHNSNKKPAL